MGKAERRKGHNFEREVARIMQDCGFPEARRLLEYQESEANGVDLAYTPPFLIQCKCMKKTPNIPLVFDGFRDITPPEIPVVVFRVLGRGEYACFKLEDALNFLKPKV